MTATLTAAPTMTTVQCAYKSEWINEMRNWIMDCDEDADAEYMTEAQVLRVIKREYEGGIEAFLKAIV